MNREFFFKIGNQSYHQIFVDICFNYFPKTYLDKCETNFCSSALSSSKNRIRLSISSQASYTFYKNGYPGISYFWKIRWFYHQYIFPGKLICYFIVVFESMRVEPITNKYAVYIVLPDFELEKIRLHLFKKYKTQLNAMLKFNKLFIYRK